MASPAVLPQNPKTPKPQNPNVLNTTIFINIKLFMPKDILKEYEESILG